MRERSDTVPPEPEAFRLSSTGAQRLDGEAGIAASDARPKPHAPEEENASMTLSPTGCAEIGSAWHPASASERHGNACAAC